MPGTPVKKARYVSTGLLNRPSRLRRLNVGSLLTLWTLHHVKRDFLAFFKGLETAHIDCRKVREQVFAAIIRSDKTEAFCVVEPFNCTSCHVIISLPRKYGTPRETV